LLPAALRAAQSADISVTQRPILMFFAPQGQLVAPMAVKFGMDRHAEFHPHRCNDTGIGPQN